MTIKFCSNVTTEKLTDTKYGEEVQQQQVPLASTPLKPIIEEKEEKEDGTVPEENKQEASAIVEEPIQTPLKRENTMNSALKMHQVPGSLQVINFVRTNLSYEYASKYMDANESIA